MPQIIFILFFLFESAKLRRTTFCVIAISEMALFVGKCSNDQSRPFIGWVEGTLLILSDRTHLLQYLQTGYT